MYMKESVKQTAADIVEYIDRNFNTNADIYDIAEIININLGSEIEYDIEEDEYYE